MLAGYFSTSKTYVYMTIVVDYNYVFNISSDPTEKAWWIFSNVAPEFFFQDSDQDQETSTICLKI